MLPGKYDAEKYADALGQMILDRYGSEEAWKKTLATDPIGVLADMSIFLTGGAAAAARVPMLSKAASVVQRAGQAVDPINLAVKGAKLTGKGAAELIGDLGTWTGGESMRQAHRAGKEGGTSLLDHMRDNARLEDAVTPVKDAVTTAALKAGDDYNTGMVTTRADKTVLDFQPISDALRAKADVGRFHDITVARSTDPAFAELSKVVDEFRMADPAIYHTAAGFDALKRSIGDLRDSYPFGTPSRNMLNGVYHAVKDEIVKQDPTYARTMRAYSDARKWLDELTGTLSLGPKARNDTALRKLQSTMRNNVYSNQGHRLQLLEELEAASGKNLMAPLAGQAMQPWFPRGFGKLELGALAATSALHNPAVLLAAPFMSPRLMGEAAYATGAAGRELSKLRRALGITVEGTGSKARKLNAIGRFNEGVADYQPFADPQEQFSDAAAHDPRARREQAAAIAERKLTDMATSGPQRYADGGIVKLKHGGPVNPKKPTPKSSLTRAQLMEAIRALSASGVLPKRKFADGGFTQTYNGVTDPNAYLNYGANPFSQFTSVVAETPPVPVRTGAATGSATSGALPPLLPGGEMDVGDIGDPAQAPAPGAPAATDAPSLSAIGDRAVDYVSNLSNGRLGALAGMLAPFPGASFVGGALGTISDVAAAHRSIANRNSIANEAPPVSHLSFMDSLSALGNSVFGGLFGTSAKDQAQRAMMAGISPGNKPSGQGFGPGLSLGFNPGLAAEQDQAEENAAAEAAAAAEDADAMYGDSLGGSDGPGESYAGETDDGHGAYDGWKTGGRVRRPSYVSAH